MSTECRIPLRDCVPGHPQPSCFSAAHREDAVSPVDDHRWLSPSRLPDLEPRPEFRAFLADTDEGCLLDEDMATKLRRIFNQELSSRQRVGQTAEGIDRAVVGDTVEETL